MTIVSLMNAAYSELMKLVTNSKLLRLCSSSVAASLLAALTWLPAQAGSSPWFKTDGAQIRLIAMPSPDGKKIQAGLQIELEKGWKTYWRAPGASGLPPQINLSTSKNVASSKLYYPVPSTFGDRKNLTAGYKKPVTFPITVEPLFANKPVTLNATGILGICADVCVPVQFQLTLTEDGGGISKANIASALFNASNNLPKAAKDGFKVESVKYSSEPKRQLQIKAHVPSGTSSSALFIEGPDDWYLTPVLADGIEDGFATFQISLDQIPKEAAPENTKLKFSLVADGKGVEQDLTPTIEP